MRAVFALGMALALTASFGCGAGVPVTVRIDEFEIDLDLDDVSQTLTDELGGLGVLPPGVLTLPEVWPASLPDIQYSTTYASDPVVVDLTPEEGEENFEKYEEINQYSDAIRRIEVNRLVIRSDQNNAPIEFPALTVQVASEADADPDDRRAWFTVGDTDGGPAGFVGDQEFRFVRGGESFFSAQLEDEARELAIRVLAPIRYDTAENPERPRGRIKLRLIVEVTFFVEPDTLFGTLE